MLRRKNKIAQGISHYKAASTSIWSAEAKSEERVALDSKLGFDFPQIHQRVQWVGEQDPPVPDYLSGDFLNR